MPLRLALGIAFAAHGYAKFAGGIGRTAEFFGSVGIPFPGFFAPFVASVELAGGILLILGMMTRFSSLALAADMLTAIFVARLGPGLPAPELEIVLLAGALALFLGDAKVLSLGRLFCENFLGCRYYDEDEECESEAEDEDVGD